MVDNKFIRQFPFLIYGIDSQSHFFENILKWFLNKEFQMNKITIFSSVLTSIIFMNNVHADNNSVTQNELAAIYVLSEICPNLIGNNSKFNNGYQQLVKSYLPNETNPVEMLEQHAKSPNFQKYLIEERKTVKAASINDNREICEEVLAYSIPEKKEPTQSDTYTPSSRTSSSMGGSFLTGLLKTAVGVAVARQTGNNALGAQVALASPEELNGLTNQVALEARQHSEAEARRKQEVIRSQQARQLQEQQAAMQRAQQQSSYGTFGSSNGTSSGSYGTISSGSSNNNYGNSSSTISSGQNNSSTNKPKTERINVPSQKGCVSFAWTKQADNTQWFKFTNGCAYPIKVYWSTKVKGGYAAELRGGQSENGWLLRDRDKIENYTACSLKNGKYDIYYDRTINQCWSYADF